MFNITVGFIGENNTQTGTLSGREIAIGRDPANDLVLDNGSVSRTHCRLVAIEGATIVLDENSKNGTWLNGKPVDHPSVLKFEDELVIGPYTLRVQSLVGQAIANDNLGGVALNPPLGRSDAPIRGRTALAKSLSTLEARRQELRWLMREPAAHPRVDGLLRAALRDADLEVRLTGALTAARLRAREVLPLLQSSDTPALLQEVDEPRERRFLEQLWYGVIRYLQERRNPGDTVPGRDPLRPLWQLLAGELEVTDSASMLLHALSTPLETGVGPTELPPGVVEEGGLYFLKRSGMPLQWVPPIEHWLGAPPHVRRVRAPGFFVARVPMDRPLAKWVGQPQPVRVVSDHEQVWLGSCKEAERLCAQLSELEGVKLRLPTADEWEMAARGTDGRRYPWGNMPQENWEECASPWGVDYLVGDVPEWTFEPESDTQLLRGGVEARTWVRHPVYPGEEEFAAALRPVIASF